MIFFVYLSRNVKTSARQRKPLKLQTSIIASIVAFDDVLIFNVDVEYDRKFCSAVVSILVLVSYIIKFVVGDSVIEFIKSIFDFTRTRNADVRDEDVVVDVVGIAKRMFYKIKY
jgi:hypothetical protein